ncbi:MAG: hypothetical protein AAFV98_06830 [Chloroflexota bacterium]
MFHYARLSEACFFVASYIANQSADSLGTGGTDFMHWLQQLIDETQAHLITS